MGVEELVILEGEVVSVCEDNIRTRPLCRTTNETMGRFYSRRSHEDMCRDLHRLAAAVRCYDGWLAAQDYWDVLWGICEFSSIPVQENVRKEMDDLLSHGLVSVHHSRIQKVATMEFLGSIYGGCELLEKCNTGTVRNY